MKNLRHVLFAGVEIVEETVIVKKKKKKMMSVINDDGQKVIIKKIPINLIKLKTKYWSYLGQIDSSQQCLTSSMEIDRESIDCFEEELKETMEELGIKKNIVIVTTVITEKKFNKLYGRK